MQFPLCFLMGITPFCSREGIKDLHRKEHRKSLPIPSQQCCLHYQHVSYNILMILSSQRLMRVAVFVLLLLRAAFYPNWGSWGARPKSSTSLDWLGSPKVSLAWDQICLYPIA